VEGKKRRKLEDFSDGVEAAEASDNPSRSSGGKEEEEEEEGEEAAGQEEKEKFFRA
jgi:hypothetical protein